MKKGLVNIAVLSDLHGLQPRFEKAKKLLEQKIKKLLIAGDIATLGYPEVQQANVKHKFVFDMGDTKSILAGAGNDPNVLNFVT